MARNPVTDEGIGERVREWRRRRNKSQPELGEALGVTEQMIQKYETGKSSLTVLKLAAIAAFLRCKTTDLMP